VPLQWLGGDQDEGVPMPLAPTGSRVPQVAAESMHQNFQAGQVEYASLDGFEVVGIPYRGSKLEMDLVLPKAIVPNLAGSVRPAELATLLAALKPSTQDLVVEMPRFAIDTSLEWASPASLASLGIPIKHQCDFRPMLQFGPTEAGTLCLIAIDQRARIRVFEKGTEGAVVTAVTLEAVSKTEPLTIYVDRPFLFLIRDVATGAIFFGGQVEQLP
jgi:serpin B